jgi:hypothetical protein
MTLEAPPGRGDPSGTPPGAAEADDDEEEEDLSTHFAWKGWTSRDWICLPCSDICTSMPHFGFGFALMYIYMLLLNFTSHNWKKLKRNVADTRDNT